MVIPPLRSAPLGARRAIVCGLLIAFVLVLAGWEKAQATSAALGPPGRVEPKLRFVSGGPEELTVDRAGNIYGADCRDAFVFRVSSRRTLTIVAGTDTQGFSGDGGLALKAELITTVAGNGEHGYSGDGGPATHARLSDPYVLVFDARGNLYVAEPDEGVVRRIDKNGVITTVAGTGKLGFSGDGGPATKGRLNAPFGLALDAAGNLYIADNGNGRIRKVDRRGVITTFFNGR